MSPLPRAIFWLTPDAAASLGEKSGLFWSAYQALLGQRVLNVAYPIGCLGVISQGRFGLNDHDRANISDGFGP